MKTVLRLFEILIISLLMQSISVFGQSFSFFGIDSTTYPTMKAKFFAFDTSGKQIKTFAKNTLLKQSF